MAISKVTAKFQCGVDKVWKTVTSLEEYGWRSDISKIVVTKPEKQFEEHTKEGYITTFTITAYEPFERYEFDMENDNMAGHWTGLFSFDDNVTTIEFTEDVTAKKAIMKPFVKGYLKKQQKKYIENLKEMLGCKLL